MNKAEKRNGSWRIRVHDYTDKDGKRHTKSFTAPTKAAVEYKAAQFIRERDLRTRADFSDPTVGEALERYIEIKALLSPTTIDGYENKARNGFKHLRDVKISKLDDVTMQLAVNKEATRISERTHKQISAKTLENEYSLLKSAIKMFSDKNFHVVLPKKQKHIKVYPPGRYVVQAVYGTELEVPCLLAYFGSFRMSEICGFMCSDLDPYKCTMTVNRTKVSTKKGDVVKENAKSQKGIRQNTLPPELIQVIMNLPVYQEYLATGKDDFLIQVKRRRIFDMWQRTCRNKGLPKLTFHDLRHIHASTMASENIPTLYAKDIGGWETDYVMVDTYQHVFSEDKRRYVEKINKRFSSEYQEAAAIEQQKAAGYGKVVTMPCDHD